MHISVPHVHEGEHAAHAGNHLLGNVPREQVDHLHARFADALHRKLIVLRAPRLEAVGPTDMRPTEVRDRGSGGSPFARERLDGPLWDAGYLRSPFRGLLNAVVLAHDVVRHLVEMDSVGVHVLLVVEPFFDPYVDQSEIKRSVRVREDGDPRDLIMRHCGIGAERVHSHHLDA